MVIWHCIIVPDFSLLYLCHRHAPTSMCKIYTTPPMTRLGCVTYFGHWNGGVHNAMKASDECVCVCVVCLVFLYCCDPP